MWQVKQVPGVCGAEAASGRAGDARHIFGQGKSQPKGSWCQRGSAEWVCAQAKQPRRNRRFFPLMQVCTSQCQAQPSTGERWTSGCLKSSNCGTHGRSGPLSRFSTGGVRPCWNYSWSSGSVLTLLAHGTVRGAFKERAAASRKGSVVRQIYHKKGPVIPNK